MAQYPLPSIARSIHSPFSLEVNILSTSRHLSSPNITGCGSVPSSCCTCTVTAIPAHSSGSSNSSVSTPVLPSPPSFKTFCSGQYSAPLKVLFTILTSISRPPFLCPVYRIPLCKTPADILTQNTPRQLSLLSRRGVRLCLLLFVFTAGLPTGRWSALCSSFRHHSPSRPAFSGCTKRCRPHPAAPAASLPAVSGRIRCPPHTPACILR